MRQKSPSTIATNSRKICWSKHCPQAVFDSLTEKYYKPKTEELLRSILPSAPSRLVYLLGRIGKGDQILQRLLTDKRMGRPWIYLRKKLIKPAAFDKFWGEIVTRYQFSGEQSGDKRRLRSDEKKHFLQIAKNVENLRKAIENKQLHKPAYHFFPNDFCVIAFSANWANLNDFERDQIAPSAYWPSMPEVLDGLAERAKLLAQEAMTRPVLAERKTRDQRLRFFAQALTEYLRKVTGGPMNGCVAAVTSVVFQRHVGEKEIKQLLRHQLPQKQKGGA